MFEIGIGTWPFGAAAKEPFPLPVTLDRIVGWGYCVVDYGALPPHPVPRPGTAEEAALRQEFVSRSLAVSAVAPSFAGLSLLRRSDHDEYFERFLDQVAICKSLDCPIVRLDTLDSPEAGAGGSSTDAIEQIATVWSRCAAAAAQAGVTIAWEFEPCCVLNTPREICALVTELDLPGFGVLYDTAHAYAAAEVGARHVQPGETLPGGQVELIERLAGRIVHVHVLDSDGSLNEVPGTTIHMPIGRGDVEFSAVIPPLLAASGEARWTIDLCFWEDPAGAAEESRLALTALLEQAAPVSARSEREAER